MRHLELHRPRPSGAPLAPCHEAAALAPVRRGVSRADRGDDVQRPPPGARGDLLRVQYLARRTGKSRGTILGTEVVDRWLDWWGWFPVLFLLALTGTVPSWLYKALAVFALLLGSTGTMMLVLSRRGYTPKTGSRFSSAYLSFRAGVEQFRSPRMLLLAMLVAPLPWLWESIAIGAAAHAFGIDLTLGKSFSALIGFNVAMIVPSPGEAPCSWLYHRPSIPMT